MSGYDPKDATNLRGLKDIQPRILHNRIRCRRCGEVIESLHQHDYRPCKCGAVFVDGGHAYQRIGGNPEDWDDLTVLSPAFAASLLRRATEDVCGLAFISESEIEATLEQFQIIASVIAGTPYEMDYRRSLVVAFEAFGRKQSQDLQDAIDRLDTACGQLLEAVSQ